MIADAMGCCREEDAWPSRPADQMDWGIAVKRDFMADFVCGSMETWRDLNSNGQSSTTYDDVSRLG